MGRSDFTKAASSAPSKSSKAWTDCANISRMTKSFMSTHS
jgi:hypothetical protein